MKYEYHEGSEAAKRFEEGMKKLFRVPKSVVADIKPKLKSRPKRRKASKD